jgi:gliding motility-associated-like protein
VDYTCVDAPFNISVRLNVKPEVLTWGLSNISVISPNIDVVETNPVAVDSVVINGQTYYDYILTGDYTISVAGTYNIPIYVEHPDVEGCGNRLEITLNVVVKPAPLAEFDLNFGGCFSETAIFEGVQVSSNGSNVSTWSWNFGDNTTSTVQNPSHTWSAPGSYPVSLSILTEDGCLGDSTVMVEVFDKPDVNVVQDNITVCNNESVTFEIQNPIAGVTYQWYNTATGGTPIATGTTFTIPNVVGTMEYWVEAVSSACVSDQRVQVTAIETAALPAPVVSVQSVGADFVTFEWTAVPGAIGYEVSINNGATWMTPSSGSTGLTHTVSGLQPMESVTLVARAITGNSCNALISDPVTGETIGDDLYIPNAFTPNGDGINDVLQVYGRSVDRVRFIVFNQWGEKIHESTNPSNVWDGKHRGKLQPSGVYIYVCEIVLRNGTKMTKKGSINLIR